MRSVLNFLDKLENYASSHRPKPPGLSSQAAQIKPLSPEAIALGKKHYLGPKRPRSADFYRDRRTKKAVRKLPF